LQEFHVESFGLAGENDFGLVKGDDGVVDVTLGISAEVDRELTVLLVVGGVEAMVVEICSGGGEESWIAGGRGERLEWLTEEWLSADDSIVKDRKEEETVLSRRGD